MRYIIIPLILFGYISAIENYIKQIKTKKDYNIVHLPFTSFMLLLIPFIVIIFMVIMFFGGIIIKFW